MRVFEIMSEDVATIEPGASVVEAAQVMRLQGINHLVVMREGALEGIVSARDLPAAPRRGAAPRVGDVMQGPVVTVTPQTTVARAANVMAGRAIGSLVVAQRGKVVGIVTVTDLLRLVGAGAARQPKRAARPILRTQVPHRKQRGAGGSW